MGASRSVSLVRSFVGGVAVLGLFAACDSSSRTREVAEPRARTGKFLKATENGIEGSYIVMLEAGVSPEMGRAMAAEHRGEVKQELHALNGFVATMTESEARDLARDVRVRFVEEDARIQLVATQTGATWGIDRIDQRDLPLSTTYTYVANGTGVHAYIIDTGINTAHAEFGGRAQVGTDTIGDGNNGQDCHGHGTHVAGTVGGTTYGVAKNVRLWAVRVLSCGGSGTISGVVSGIDWVTANHVKPAVANMSLGGGLSTALNEAVQKSVAAGVTYAVAAGNESTTACSRSPASTPEAITVGATDRFDGRASFSNYGTCVDIFGPGVDITSAWIGSNTATNTISGTSMATPHVAGAVALYLQHHRTATPEAVGQIFSNQGTPGKVGNPGTGSPNLLLYTGFITGNPNGDTVPPVATLTSPAPGSALTGVVSVSADATDNVGVVSVKFYAGPTVIGTDTAAPYTVNWDTQAVANGAYELRAVASDAEGNNGASANVPVQVVNPGFAVYDPTFMAPLCGTSGSKCDTGALLVGRGPLGPEPNQPNTIANSCPDGSSGSFHSDESLDRLKVSTTDGQPFSPGKQVKVEATAWVYNASNALDIFMASDAAARNWEYVTTIQAGPSGQQLFTAFYTLPQGTMQAVRGIFRYGGAAAPCTGSSYDDRDDVVFKVGEPPDVTPPTAALTSPAPGSVVFGMVPVRATATDNKGVTKVDFFVDATLIGTDEAAPYEVTWNADSFNPGSHALTAKASDAAGNVGVSPAVTVTVADITPPMTAISVPAEGANVTDVVAIEANATDNVGVMRVEFYWGTTLLGTDTAEPWSFSWNTAQVPPGEAVLTTKAYDAAGNIGTSSPRTVQVVSLEWRGLPRAAAYQTTHRQTNYAGLSAALNDLGANGYVVTALAVTSPVPYTLVASKAVGSTTTYQYAFRTTNGGGLARTLNALGAEGYLVTAMEGDWASTTLLPYTVIGLKPVGATATYQYEMRQSLGSDLRATLTTMGTGGYLVMSMTANTAPYTLIGVKKVGVAMTYQYDVRHTDAAGLPAALNAMGGGGYMLTAMAADATPYTLVGVRRVGLPATTYQHSRRQAASEGLGAAFGALAGGGHLVTGLTSGNAPYTVVGVK